MLNDYTEERVCNVFSAVFSQKPYVSKIRVAILKALDKSSEGKMRFRDVLKEVQSIMKDVDYSSQKLSYDLRVLRENKIVNQTWDGEYTLTPYGHYLIMMYKELVHKIGKPLKDQRIGFVGEVNGRIIIDKFDPQILGEELARYAIFRRKFLATKDRYCLELNDHDDEALISEIEIFEGGYFHIKVILYPADQNLQEDIIKSFEYGEEWYETAKGIVQTILYYIKKTARKLWTTAQIESMPPDSYPI
jgi:DNA-binding transcriptional ArsR family regulator